MHDPKAGWTAVPVGKATDAATNIVHVVPNYDLSDHYLSKECFCKPSIEDCFGEKEHEGQHTGYLISHNAWDGRE